MPKSGKPTYNTIPDGTLRKLMDVLKLEQDGWKANIVLMDGIRSTYDWFIENNERFTT